MIAKDNNMQLRQILVLYLDSLKESVKAKKAIFAFIIYGLFILIAAKLGSVFELGRIYLADSFNVYLTVPLSVYIPYMVSLFCVPLLALLLSYDEINADLSNGTLKYLIAKTRRSSLLIARLAAQMTIIGILITIVITLTTLFSVTQNISVNYTQIFYGWLFLLIYGGFFVSVGILLSTIIRKSQTALFTGIALLFVFLIMLTSKYFYRLSPFNYVTTSFTFAVGNLAFLLLTGAAAIIASYLILRSKDLC